MLTPPPGQELYPYHDSPSRLCIYAAYGSPRLSGIRGPRVTTCVQPGTQRQLTRGGAGVRSCSGEGRDGSAVSVMMFG